MSEFSEKISELFIEIRDFSKNYLKNDNPVDDIESKCNKFLALYGLANMDNIISDINTSCDRLQSYVSSVRVLINLVSNYKKLECFGILSANLPLGSSLYTEEGVLKTPRS